MLLFLIVPAQAQAGPVAVVEGFFKAVDSQRYGDAWSFLDPGSQAYFVDEVVKIAKMDKAKVKNMFDTNSPELKPFWDSFRKSARTDIYVKCVYSLLNKTGDNATVSCKLPEGAKTLELYAANKQGRWGFDYYTTFLSE